MTAQTAAAEPVELPLEGQVVQRILNGSSPGKIAERLHIDRDQVLAIRDKYGWPDKTRMRHRLGRLLPAPGGRDDHPAFGFLRLGSLAARDRDLFRVQHLIAGCDDREKNEIIAAALILISPAADFRQLAEWFDAPAIEWSEATLQAEAARFLDAGARDRTARAATTEMTRRASNS